MPKRKFGPVKLPSLRKRLAHLPETKIEEAEDRYLELIELLVRVKLRLDRKDGKKIKVAETNH